MITKRRSAKPIANTILDRRRADRLVTSDRRYHRRVKVDVLINRFVDGHPYLCRMTDISRTGARLASLLEPVGMRAARPRFMGLQFQLPGRTEILTASGELMGDEGSKSGGNCRTVGLRFTNLPPDAAWAIEAFLNAA